DTPQQCFFCLWDGYGWLRGGSAVATASAVRADGPTAHGSSPAPPPAFSPEELGRPQLHLPGRDYLLLAGPLQAALRIGDRPTTDWFLPQSPNLFWPAHRAWCVA